MHKIMMLLLAAELAAGTSVGTTAGAAELAAWSVDRHVKVFCDSQPPGEPGTVMLRAARNEYEPAQIAFRAEGPLRGVRIEITPLVHADGKGSIGGGEVRWNFVGYIPLERNTQRSERIRLRAAPCEVPDPLLEARAIDVEAGATQPVWITVRVPEDAAAGRYRGRVAVVAGDSRATLPVELTVDPFTLPDERHLLVTNWFHVDRIARHHGVALWSEQFWALLERYAHNMAAHRQNVVYAPWTLIEITREPDGKLSFDYGRFDRFVEVFEQAGVADRIELTHLGRFGPGGHGGTEIVLRSVPAVDRQSGRSLNLAGEEAMPRLLGDLERHLDERGWLAKSMIHVADEPSIGNVESWREVSALVHRAAPRLRRIDAIETIDFSGALEVWVPKLSHFDRWRDAYEARRGDGEFWYYICCHPYGNVYPNRFLDYPLSRVRVLHWINFSADLKGYLHWGLDAWGDDPFGPPSDRLPPGDTHVIYPGSEGPLDSIRWEIQRESIEDFEYLHLLTVKTAEAKKRLGPSAEWIDPRRRAEELCRRVVPTLADTEKDPVRIMTVRGAIADEIVALGRSPLLLVETEPPAGSTLVDGPIVVEVRGVTRPGAAVKVNGSDVPLRPDGTFACRTRPRGAAGEITIEASHDGKTKTTVRRFRIRD